MRTRPEFQPHQFVADFAHAFPAGFHAIEFVDKSVGQSLYDTQSVFGILVLLLLLTA